MKEEFVYRPYGKSELAMAYIRSSVSQRAALNWLNREISLFPGLPECLAQLGYRRRQRVLTIAQVRAIVECIGEP